jgi:hypothetical protein
MDGKLVSAQVPGQWGTSIRFEPRLGYVLAFLKYGLERMDKLEGMRRGRGGVNIVLHSEIKDPMAKPDDPPRPLRILGQVQGPDGEIIDAKTGKIVTPAPKGTDGLRDEMAGTEEDDDALEVLEDVDPHPNCPLPSPRT